MDIYVRDTNGTSINNSNVTVLDVNSHQVFGGITDASGYIGRLTLMKYSQNATLAIYSTNYTINASKDGYTSNGLEID